MPESAGEEDPQKAALRVLVAQLPMLGEQGISCAKLIDRLYSPERMRGYAAPDGFDGLREALETLAPPPAGRAPSAQKLAAR